MTPQPQTVEDLGKLVKSKYPDAYASMSDIDVGQKVKAKYPDAYGQFTDITPNQPEKDPNTIIDTKVFGHPLKVTWVNPEEKQGARDLFTPGSRLKGAHELYSGIKSDLMPLGIAGAIAAPEIALPAMALGKVGGLAGKYGSQALGANEDVSNAIGDVGELAAGGVGAKFGPNISSAAKVAFPDVAMGASKAAGGMGVGEAMHAAGLPGSEFMTALLARPGIKQIGQGLVAGAKDLIGKGVPPGPVESPVTPKGPSIGDLKTALKQGVINQDEFNARIDAMKDLTPETKNLHKANTAAANAPKSTIKYPVNNPKTLSLGQLETAVRAGRMNVEDFTGRVKELGYNEEHANEITEQLKDKMKSEKESETEDESKNQKIGEVKSPASKPEAKTEEIRPVENPSGIESFLETEPPYKPPITQHQIEESQSTARTAKETKLARHLAADKDINLDELANAKHTPEYLDAISKEAGLKRVASLRTLTNSINRARQLRDLSPKVDPIDEVSDKIFSSMARLNKESNSPNATVTFDKLRQQPELKSVPKETFDKAVVKLQNDRKALMMIHGHAKALPEAARNDLVEHEGNYYVSMYPR
jgi:hypothetical protein